MIELVYISALIVAVAFATLVIYLIKTLKSANQTLEHVATTIASVEKQMNGRTLFAELHKKLGHAAFIYY